MIPKVIHHVWPGSDPFNPKFHEWRLSWMRHHPDWQFRFWRGNEATLDTATRQAMADPQFSATPKSDMLRFAVLAIHGGLYVDTDFECLRPLDDLMERRFIAGYEDDAGTVCPSLIGCLAGDPMLRRMAAMSRERAYADPAHANKSPNKVTSVVPFTELCKREGADVMRREAFYPVGYWERGKLAGFVPGVHNFALHHWSGKDADGWTRQEVRP
jgi:hypothetical protein